MVTAETFIRFASPLIPSGSDSTRELINIGMSIARSKGQLLHAKFQKCQTISIHNMSIVAHKFWLRQPRQHSSIGTGPETQEGPHKWSCRGCRHAASSPRVLRSVVPRRTAQGYRILTSRPKIRHALTSEAQKTAPKLRNRVPLGTRVSPKLAHRREKTYLFRVSANDRGVVCDSPVGPPNPS